MGTSTTIYILGAFLAFLTLNMATNRIVSGQSDAAFYYYKQAQLRNMNTSAFNMLAAKVSANSTYRVSSYASISMYDGTAKYRVLDTLVGTDTLLKLEIIGNYLGETKVTVAFYNRGTSVAGVPAAFKYAAMGGGSISVSGNSSIVPDGSFNANVHTNINLSISGSAQINGFVTYGNSFSGSTSKVTPVSNPGSTPVTQKTGTVAVPTFNSADFISKATATYAGDLSLNSGTFNLGTKANPAIIYVAGNLKANGNVTISGYGIFVVRGNVEMSGNVNYATQEAGTNTCGMYAEGNIQMSGNNTYRGQMFAKGDIQLGGNAKLYGTATAAKELQLGGNNTIYYRPASTAITNPVFQSSSTSTSGRTTFAFVYE